MKPEEETQIAEAVIKLQDEMLIAMKEENEALRELRDKMKEMLEQAKKTSK